jgi:hypothetical protein
LIQTRKLVPVRGKKRQGAGVWCFIKGVNASINASVGIASRWEFTDWVGSGIQLGKFVERALVRGELIWRDAKHEALDGEVRRKVVGMPVENVRSGFSDAGQGLVFIEEFWTW